MEEVRGVGDCEMGWGTVACLGDREEKSPRHHPVELPPRPTLPTPISFIVVVVVFHPCLPPQMLSKDGGGERGQSPQLSEGLQRLQKASGRPKN